MVNHSESHAITPEEGIKAAEVRTSKRPSRSVGRSWEEMKVQMLTMEAEGRDLRLESAWG